MKNLIALTFAFFIATVSFAQKSELKAAEKAIKNGNFADAKAAITSAESLIASADQKLKAKFYFLKGQALYANGTGNDNDNDMAFESFDKLIALEKTGKKTYTEKVNAMKSGMINSFLTKANADLEKKNYVSSSKGFEKAYRLSPSDTLYLYYAASIAVNGQEYDSALKYYDELKNIGYTGVEEQFVAVDKETNEEEIFANKGMRDISVKAGTHIKPSTKMTEPRSAEIVKNVALIYISQGNNDKALAAINDARAMSPNDLNLLLSEANIQYKMGNVDKYKSLISEAIKMDPNNPELLYNLGVTTAASDPEAAKGYYKKAIELDPTYFNAQINMAALILGEETSINDAMSQLGTSASDDRKYDELKLKKKTLYESAVPYLMSALELKPNNIDAAKTLMSIFSVLEDNAKFKEYKAIVDSLENGGN